MFHLQVLDNILALETIVPPKDNEIALLLGEPPMMAAYSKACKEKAKQTRSLS